jgi:hypothetical protein
MADDVEITEAREAQVAELLRRHRGPYVPPVTVAGECDLCGEEHPRTAEIPDPDDPRAKVMACARCRDGLEQRASPRLGRGGRYW